jgi:hypothetical protein
MLARRRDARMTGRARIAIDADRRLPHVVEVRHPSFVSDDFRSLEAAGASQSWLPTPQASGR